MPGKVDKEKPLGLVIAAVDQALDMSRNGGSGEKNKED